jgi:hypothetical protein
MVVTILANALPDVVDTGDVDAHVRFVGWGSGAAAPFLNALRW